MITMLPAALTQRYRSADLTAAVHRANDARREWLTERLLRSRTVPRAMQHATAVILLDPFRDHLDDYEPAGADMLRLTTCPDWMARLVHEPPSIVMLTAAACRIEGVIYPTLWSSERARTCLDVTVEMVHLWLRSCEAAGHVLHDAERDLCEAVESHPDACLLTSSGVAAHEHHTP